jgi:hypothetical protein
MVPVLAAGSRSRLHQRVERILEMSRAPHVRAWRVPLVGGAVALVTCAFAIGNVHVVAAAVASAVVITVDPATALASVASTSTRPSVRPSAPDSASRPRQNRGPVAPVRTSAQDTSAADERRKASATEDPKTTAIATLPVPLVSSAFSAPTFEPVTGPLATGAPHTAPAPAPVPPKESAVQEDPAPWTQAADAGVAIGRASQTAGVKTAGFFSRLGKKIARSF